MRLRVLALLALLAAAALTAAAFGSWRLPAAAPAPRSFERGMVFGLFARNDPAHTDRGLAEMKALGVDSICIMIPWVIPDVRSTSMAPRNDMTPSDASLVYAMRKAHGMGMTVLLMPFLYVDRMEEGEWRGTLAPGDWNVWFERYGEFVLHYAALAGEHKVAYFSVGSELCSTESRREDWLRLIGRVRHVYKGLVTYSANWDHRDSLSFAASLDLLGMNAYFELSRDEEPGEADLAAAWSRLREDIEAWRRPFGKRLLITEVGYPSRRGTASDPWNYDKPDPVPDPAGQLACYRAFRTAWSGDPALQGVYFYIWWGDGGPGDTGYTPRGKPAEQVIRDWYTGGVR
ncbi:MAG TPA: hypothetical protein VFP98_06175 [Candidatus Polarisedimenticolia bacterium]|nr:hypothetical protein [Candidatus Polarisedimenticolia bacterium]